MFQSNQRTITLILSIYIQVLSFESKSYKNWHVPKLISMLQRFLTKVDLPLTFLLWLLSRVRVQHQCHAGHHQIIHTAAGWYTSTEQSAHRWVSGVTGWYTSTEQSAHRWVSGVTGWYTSTEQSAHRRVSGVTGWYTSTEQSAHRLVSGVRLIWVGHWDCDTMWFYWLNLI